MLLSVQARAVGLIRVCVSVARPGGWAELQFAILEDLRNIAHQLNGLLLFVVSVLCVYSNLDL